jgi:hypothetical protein
MSSPLPNLEYMIATEIKMQLLQVKRNEEERKKTQENYRKTFSRSLEVIPVRRCSCNCRTYSELASTEEIERRTKLLRRLDVEEQICGIQ